MEPAPTFSFLPLLFLWVEPAPPPTPSQINGGAKGGSFSLAIIIEMDQFLLFKDARKNELSHITQLDFEKWPAFHRLIQL